MRVAQQALGWTPAQFWGATVWEFETAILTRLREVEKPPLSDDETREMFARMSGEGGADV